MAMIHEHHGNLLEAGVDAVVNTVNTVGVMGKGIALQFKQAFPDNYQAYRQACRRGEVVIGKMLVFDTQQLGSPRLVINFPTKRHWRSPSRLSDIQAGLVDLVEVVRVRSITSIAVPALGCGNGGLDWNDVRPLIVDAFAQMPAVTVALFPPAGAPSPAQMPIATPRPPMTLGRAAVVALILGYVAQARTERVEASDGASLLEIQKLMYLLQLLGRPMRLAYAKGRYGPYAEALNHQLQVMEGHFLRGYGDRSQRVLDLQPIIVLPDVAAETNAWIQSTNPDLHRQVQEVLDLIDGFASPYGLELLATVHWAANHEPDGQSSAAALLAAVRAWSQRKATLFSEAHVRAAYDRLTERGLVATTPS